MSIETKIILIDSSDNRAEFLIASDKIERNEGNESFDELSVFQAQISFGGQELVFDGDFWNFAKNKLGIKRLVSDMTSFGTGNIERFHASFPLTENDEQALGLWDERFAERNIPVSVPVIGEMTAGEFCERVSGHISSNLNISDEAKESLRTSLAEEWIQASSRSEDDFTDTIIDAMTATAESLSLGACSSAESVLEILKETTAFLNSENRKTTETEIEFASIDGCLSHDKKTGIPSDSVIESIFPLVSGKTADEAKKMLGCISREITDRYEELFHAFQSGESPYWVDKPEHGKGKTRKHRLS